MDQKLETKTKKTVATSEEKPEKAKETAAKDPAKKFDKRIVRCDNVKKYKAKGFIESEDQTLCKNTNAVVMEREKKQQNSFTLLAKKNLKNTRKKGLLRAKINP